MTNDGVTVYWTCIDCVLSVVFLCILWELGTWHAVPGRYLWTPLSNICPHACLQLLPFHETVICQDSISFSFSVQLKCRLRPTFSSSFFSYTAALRIVRKDCLCFFFFPQHTCTSLTSRKPLNCSLNVWLFLFFLVHGVHGRYSSLRIFARLRIAALGPSCATFPGHYVAKSNHSHGCSQGPKSKMFCVPQRVLPGPSVTHICLVDNGIMTNVSNMSTGSLFPDSPSSVPKVLCKGNGLESVSLYASAFQIDCS